MVLQIMKKDLCRHTFGPIILLFVFIFCLELLGSDSSNLLNYKREALQNRSIKTVDGNDLAEDEYSFGNTREDVQDLMRVIANSDEDIRLTRLAVEGLQQCQFAEIDEEISKFAKDSRNYNEFSFKIFYERGLIPNDDSHWLELIKNGNPVVAQIAVELLSDSKLQSSAFQELLWNKVKDEKTGYYLQSACFDRLAESPSQKFFQNLIDSLNNRSFRQTALETLEKITGQKIGFNPFRWKTWLDRNAGFAPKPLPKQSASLRLIDELEQPNYSDYPERYRNEHSNKNLKKGISVPYISSKDRTKYRTEKSICGIKIEGKNLLFFLDCSGSMQGTRYNLLKNEMLYMAKTLGDTYSIGVVFFPFHPDKGILKYSQNTRAFQHKLSRFLSQKKVGGPTPLYQAMKYSYEEILDPYNPVDTIYVISDGEIGNLDERANIYMLNSKLRIRINTICIQGRSDFLNGISTDNLGSFYLVN